MKIHPASGLAFPDVDDFMFHETDLQGGYQTSHLDAALKYVTNFDCAIDGGAHVGTWSLLMARRFARVIACEPSADTFECLERNLLLRNCRNVDARNVGLGAAASRATLTLDAMNAERKNTGGRRIAKGDDFAVEMIDSWDLPSVGFLKLDIEGSEPFALMGARTTLKRCKPVVLFEKKWLWTRYFGQPKDAVDGILRGVNYRPAIKVGHDEIWVPR